MSILDIDVNEVSDMIVYARYKDEAFEFINTHYKCSSNTNKKSFQISDFVFNWDGRQSKYVIDCHKFSDNTISLRGTTSRLVNECFVWGFMSSSLYIGPEIESLEGCPSFIEGSLIIQREVKIKDLTGAPRFIGGNFYICNNKNILSLNGSPESVCGRMDVSGCTNLESLEGGPKMVGKFFCGGLKLESLDGNFERVGIFEAVSCDITHISKNNNWNIYGVLDLRECEKLQSLSGLPAGQYCMKLSNEVKLDDESKDILKKFTDGGGRVKYGRRVMYDVF